MDRKQHACGIVPTTANPIARFGGPIWGFYSELIEACSRHGVNYASGTDSEQSRTPCLASSATNSSNAAIGAEPKSVTSSH